MQLLAGQPSPGADVARPVDAHLRRNLELLVAGDPFRVVRRENVGLEPELGQVRRELEGARDAAAARRREVRRDQEHPHWAPTLAGRPRRHSSSGAQRESALHAGTTPRVSRTLRFLLISAAVALLAPAAGSAYSWPL